LCFLFCLSWLPVTPSQASSAAQIGFPKACVAELETATWCGYCPYAENALSRIENDYGESELVIVSHHYNDSLMSNESLVRMGKYGVIATPTVIFSGNTYHQGGTPDVADRYEEKIEYIRGKKSPFLIHLTGEIQEDHLSLKATVLGWMGVPDEIDYTFMVCENKVRVNGRKYGWVCRDIKPGATGTSFTMDDFSVKTFELNWNIPKSVDWENVYGVFVVESMKNHQIYQGASWSNGCLEAEEYNTPLGKVFDEPPSELKISFSNGVHLENTGSCDIIDQTGNVYPSDVELDGNTLVIKPKKTLSYENKYCVYVHPGSSGIGNSSAYLHSPAFLMFEVGKDPNTPPDEPPDQPKKPAKLKLSTLGIDLGKFTENTPKEFEFTIENEGDLPLEGTISADCDWVSFTPMSFTETPVTVKCQAFKEMLKPGVANSCTITVETNAGTAKIGVKVDVPLSPPKLLFSKYKLIFEGDTMGEPQTINIKNMGQTEFYGEILPQAEWIYCNSDSFVNEVALEVQAITKNLPDGEHRSAITIKSIDATYEIPVIVRKGNVPPSNTGLRVSLELESTKATVGQLDIELTSPPQITDDGVVVTDLISTCKILSIDSNRIEGEADITTIVRGNRRLHIAKDSKTATIEIVSTCTRINYELKCAPTVKGGLLFVPLESIADAFDIELVIELHDSEGKPVTPGKEEIEIHFDFNKNTVTIDGVEKPIDFICYVTDNGTLMLDIEFIRQLAPESIEIKVDGDQLIIEYDTMILTITVGTRMAYYQYKGFENIKTPIPMPYISEIVQCHIVVPIDVVEWFFDVRLQTEISGIQPSKPYSTLLQLRSFNKTATICDDQYQLKNESIQIDDTTYLSLNDFTEILGGKSQSDSAKDEIIIENDIYSLKLRLNDKSYEVTNKTEGRSWAKSVDKAPYVTYGGVDYLSLDVLSDYFGFAYELLDEPKNVAVDLHIYLAIDSTTATINGIETILEKAPTVVAGRSLVPLRFVTETFGFKVVWDAVTRTITLVKDSLEISIKPGDTKVEVTRDRISETKTVDPPPTIIDGHTMVPIRFFSDVTGAAIEWIPDGKRIYIRYTPSP